MKLPVDNYIFLFSFSAPWYRFSNQKLNTSNICLSLVVEKAILKGLHTAHWLIPLLLFHAVSGKDFGVH